MHTCAMPPDDIAWRPEKDGSRTCPSCGSLHPDDFLDIVWKFTQAEEGYHFSTTTKGWYKFYAHRPGTANAGDGGIKFYGVHIPDVRKDEIEEAVRLAVLRQNHAWRERESKRE